MLDARLNTPRPLLLPLSGALLCLVINDATAASIASWGQPRGDESELWGRRSFMLAQNAPERTPSPVAGADRVGRSRNPDQPPPVELLADVGGVLTPRGTLVVEPQLEYTYDTANRFFFNGIEIVDALLIGIIEVDKAQRETLTASLGLRYGLTSRLEAGVRIPFVVRRDRLTRQEVGSTDERTDTLRLNGLGDIDFGLHYQINRGANDWPFFVANLRVQSDTGEGPYDVDPADEAPTGSGFWGIEPSLTVIYPSDPAVLFANIGYVHNFASDVDQTFSSGTGGIRVERVDPGDSIRASFGVGFALNERLSLSFGYEHNWIAGTEQEQRDLSTGEKSTMESDDFQVGSLLFGASLGLADNVGLNVNVAVGVTDEAPDARITVRVPISFDLFG